MSVSFCQMVKLTGNNLETGNQVFFLKKIVNNLNSLPNGDLKRLQDAFAFIYQTLVAHSKKN